MLCPDINSDNSCIYPVDAFPIGLTAGYDYPLARRPCTTHHPRMRALTVIALCIGLCTGLSGCSEPEPAEIVVVPPTVALAAIEAVSDGYEAVYDLANPNGFPITVEALWLGLDVELRSDTACLALAAGGCDGEAPGWPDGASVIEAPRGPTGAVTIAARETTECHAALEDCRVIGDEFCCDNGDGCKPLGDCFGRVTPEGSRCLVCPTHVELRVGFGLDGTPSTITARAAAGFDAAELGPTLIEAPERELSLGR